MVAASLVSHPAAASSRLVSVAFNSQAQAPQQFGSDEFRQKLLALSGKRIVVDYRGNGALGSENVVLAADVDLGDGRWTTGLRRPRGYG